MRVTIGNREFRIQFAYEEWRRPFGYALGVVQHQTAQGTEDVAFIPSDLPHEVYGMLVLRPRLHRPIRAVICELGSHDEVTGEWKAFGRGAAYCSPEDEFERERGRKLALTRALEHGNLTREGRRRFWDAYLGRGKPTTRPLAPNQTRMAERLVNGSWQACAFEDLRKGDLFRIREDDGTLVDAGKPTGVCVAAEDPKLDASGVWGIQAEPAVGRAQEPTP